MAILSEIEVKTPSNRRRTYRKPPVVRIPRGVKLGYLAGLIDGEGCILFAKSGHHSLRLIIGNTDSNMLQWLCDNIGGKICWRDPPPGLGKKPMGYWTLHGSDARVIIEAVYPYLTTKQAKAKEVMSITPTITEGLRRTGHGVNRNKN